MLKRTPFPNSPLREKQRRGYRRQRPGGYFPCFLLYLNSFVVYIPINVNLFGEVQMSESFYTYKCGHTAKYEYIKPDGAKTQSFTLVYAHGFCSDPYGRKPEEIRKWCIENGMGFFRYEIAGHGSDAARFEESTIITYTSQIFVIVGEMVDGDVGTAGASLGGWRGLLAAVQFPQKVKGFLGLAAAPDFLKKYFEAYFRPEHKEILERDGKITFPTNDFTYVITKEMIASGNDKLL